MKYVLQLLFLVHCALLQVLGVLEWTVIEKVTDYGQNVTLFCNVSNCCPQYAGWDRWTPAQRTLFIDVKTGRPNKKYDGKVIEGGYTLIIQNLTKNDLNVSYSCLYGATFGKRKFLLEEDAFTYISSTRPNVLPDKSNFSEGEIAALIAGIVALVSFPIFIYVWRRRKKRKKDKRKGKQGSEEEENMNLIPELSAPVGPMKISNITESSVDIEWEAPKHDGGSSIKEYLIEYRLANTSVYEKAGNVDGKTYRFSVKDLKYGDYYYLKVTAVNNKGPGPPLESIDGVKLLGSDENVALLDIPKEISTDSMEERKTYMEAIKSGKEMRKFIRIQVIGKDRVGKTSLVRRLLGQGIDDVGSTDGIEIARQCQIQTSDGEWIVSGVETKRNDMIRRILKAVNMKLNGNGLLSASDQRLFETDNMQVGDEPALIQEERIEQQEFDEIYSINKNTNIHSAAPDNSEDNIAGPSDLFIEGPNTETIASSVVSPVISETSNHITHHMIETTIENMDYILIEAQFQRERMASDGLVQCGIWDFAGQKDYYATHQTFFTPHAIYLLVTDIEDEIGDTKHDQSFDSIGDYIGFWFDSIHCFCKDQSAVKLCPPVVMVITGSDKVPAEQVEEKKEEYENTFLKIFGCHKKVNHRRSIHFISNTQPFGEEIRILKNEIWQIAKEMKYFAEQLPTRWINLENALDVLKDMQVNVSSWQDMKNLANKNLIEEKELLLFLNYQHKIGNIIFFEDKREYIILQPNWLVKCFRCLVCDNEKKSYGSSTTTERYRLKYEGQLSDNLIDELFKKDPELKFGEYKHYILDVMEKFEIIVKPQFLETNNRTYYIPCMIENSSTLKEIKRTLKATNARCTPWLIFEFQFLPIVYYNHILFSYIRNYKVCKEKSGDTMGDGCPALYAGKAVVYLDDTRYKMLIICFSRNAIAIQIWRWSEVDDNTYQRILNELCSTIAELERKLMHKLLYEIKAKCNTGDYASASDRIGYGDLIKRCVGGEYRCEEHDINHNKNDIENTWLKHVPAVRRRKQVKSGIPNDILDCIPSDEILDRLAPLVGKIVLQLGIELGLSVEEIERIKEKWDRDLTAQNKEVLFTWRKDRTVKPTIRVLEQAFVNIGKGVRCLKEVLKDVDPNTLKAVEIVTDKIRDNADRIIQDIQISQILDHMMTHLVISADDRREIEHYPRQNDQNKALLDIVTERREPAYSVFVDGLRNYGYEDIANDLKCDFSPSPVSAETKGLSLWNFPLYKVRLQKNYLKVITDIQHENIVDHLISREVLSVDDGQKIESGKTPQEKNRNLMDMLLRKSEQGFNEFLKALQKDSIYADLAVQIEKTEVTSTDMATLYKCRRKTLHNKLTARTNTSKQ